ncbi:alpha-1,4-glucan branching enzyme [Asterophora parasitica]|uniref:1,4-alpha-glucan-branching enzyme n=1 Tax=Asterophora parasitica TaxID=117018 RepID=A0A9P7GE50_9AGAR|nr:alpha-1,4-glucan branching enzyme [Asterophora parasitica]
MAEDKPSDSSPVISSSLDHPKGPYAVPEAGQDSDVLTSTSLSTAAVPDRSELLARARGFLQSPQIVQQDIMAKRSFLEEKGLNDVEIDSLLRELKSQTESYSVLPRPEPFREPSRYRICHSAVDVLKMVGDKTLDIPPVILIRCGLESFGKGKEGDLAKPTTEELFQHLESEVPWLISEEGLKYEQKLWEALSTCPLFIGIPSLPTSNVENFEDQKPTRWTFVAPEPAELSPLFKSMNALSNSFPKCSAPTYTGNPRQHTLQALSEFTGYISTQVYMPYRPPSSVAGFIGTGGTLGPAEDEFRREVRALKGLVLNRPAIRKKDFPVNPSVLRPACATAILGEIRDSRWNDSEYLFANWEALNPENHVPTLSWVIRRQMTFWNALKIEMIGTSMWYYVISRLTPVMNPGTFTFHPIPQYPAFAMSTPPLHPKVVLEQDGYLEPNVPAIVHRYDVFRTWKDTIERSEGGYDKFTKGYLKFGFNVANNGEVVYREWAPNASEANLIGDFNEWSRTSHPLKKDNFGVWEITIRPTSRGVCAIPHDSKVKISLVLPNGSRIERLPAWIQRVTQDLDVSPVYDARFWNPPQSQTYKFKNARPPKPTNVRIYEAHVGISTSEARVGTYKEFTRNILPRIRDLGYNVIQLMAIMEHAYYASFGYQVTSFFAASSRYGSPEDLKELIDTAHGMGLTVLLDIVHSHACKNILDGLNEFDGTDHLYFHEGAKGRHELWDSRLFNYNQHEVLRFLMSNLRFYMEVFQFDGFRFDGVTSMMYKHHGIGAGFSGGYHEYFGESADIEAIVYLMLANDAIHSIYPNAITIAEDVSGMPLLGVPVNKGGVGFDYRLSMAIPDMWIKLLKHKSDDEWDLGNITFTLTNRRHGEKSIAYCESHDQALVGDKTLAFWLMDKEMYTNMSDLTEMTPIIARGLALHKMIRHIDNKIPLTALEQWLDFPREGNQNSFHYARRQWNVVDDQLLRYRYLNNFDAAMNHLAGKTGWLESPQVKDHGEDRSTEFDSPTSTQAYVSLKNEADKVIVYERAGLLFIFNFNPTQSFTDYRVGVEEAGEYRIVLSSDEERFGGFGNVKLDGKYFTTPMEWNGRKNWVQVYIPARTCLVLAK